MINRSLVGLWAIGTLLAIALLWSVAPSHSMELAQFKGTASYYGKQFEGRKTACGTHFARMGLTMASRTLPCFTIVQVCNLRNSRCVHLTVTDRGPYVAGRIADLSEAAAIILDFRDAGTAVVDIQRLSR